MDVPKGGTTVLTALLILALQAVAAPPTESGPARLSGAAAEEFLRTAEVVDSEFIPVGVTKPQRLTLTDGEVTARATWKTISEYQAVRKFDDGGMPELGFRDSYESEVAAYELDKLLGFGFVPPTVVRKLRRERGSLMLWIDGCITEGERRRRRVNPPDSEAWSQQIYDARLFHQLIHDSDYQNLSNLLVDPDFKLWVVDQSRAFRTQGKLLNQQYLRRFSRRTLERLRELTPELLEEKLGEWLTPRQRKGLLIRRDLLLDAAEKLVAEQGAETVLF